jgi:hypothetical protein
VIYRLTQLAAPTRGGVNQSIDAEIRGIAKTNDISEYTIANEIVAARLGQALGLPIPAGVVAEDSSAKLYYFSLDVSKTGHSLPPIHPPDLLAQDPFHAAGCVIFDIYIANEDRHAGNLSLDPAFSPPRLSLFDHGHSLLGPNSGQASTRLPQVAASPGCLGPPNEPGNRQAILDHLTSAVDIDRWIARVEQLPDYVLEDACSQLSAELNVTAQLRDELEVWLKARKTSLRGIVTSHRAEFHSVTSWTL